MITNTIHATSRFLAVASAVFLFHACGHTAAVAQFDGFLQPYRQVDLSSDETGILQAMLVIEGQRVEAGEPVAKLTADDEQVQYEMAKHLADSRGNYTAAEKMLEKRQTVFSQIEQMHAQQHANENELLRAELELEMAAARLVAARDEIITHNFEMQSAKIRLDRRTITAPISGIVSQIHCREGEYVSPVRAEIITIVNVDQLYAVFNVPSNHASQFVVGKTFHINCFSGNSVAAVVESIGVAIDAESGTIQVKLVIDNSAQQLRAGDSCTLMIDAIP